MGEEVKSHYIKKMGSELGTQFYALWREVIWLHLKWGEYIYLFGAGPKCLELLNGTAPVFFWMIENVLWEDLLLHLSRLTDPPETGVRSKTGIKSNLTIRNLPRLVEPSAKKTVDELVDAALEKAKFSRDWRDRHIAHTDLDLAIGNNKICPLEDASKEQMLEALTAIQKVFIELEQRYLCEDTGYIGSITPGGAPELLGVLYFGIKEQARANQRIRVGQATEEDYPALYLRAETEPNNLS
jgi:hypothetical protein